MTIDYQKRAEEIFFTLDTLAKEAGGYKDSFDRERYKTEAINLLELAVENIYMNGKIHKKVDSINGKIDLLENLKKFNKPNY